MSWSWLPPAWCAALWPGSATGISPWSRSCARFLSCSMTIYGVAEEKQQQVIDRVLEMDMNSWRTSWWQMPSIRLMSSTRRLSARARPLKLPEMAEFSYIVLDLEWNQPLDRDSTIREPFFFDSEIIEIGALRLDEQFRETGSFKTFIRPRFYPHMNGDVVRLTKIRAQDLEKRSGISRAYADFTQWCGEDCCLCTWGPDDIPVLMDNLLMHGMDARMPCATICSGSSATEIMRDDRQCSLERAMELLHLTPDRAHDALNDARNTVQICGKMDLDGCMDEYRLRYVGYPQDRKGRLVQGREYASLAEAQRTRR